MVLRRSLNRLLIRRVTKVIKGPMPFVIHSGTTVDPSGLTTVVVCGGTIIDRQEMDRVIGDLMEFRDKLDVGITNDKIEEAVGVIKGQLEKMEVAEKAGRKAHLKRNAKLDK